jgi:fatty acid desaturase
VESREDPALRMYRRILTTFVALMALVALTVSGVLFSRGRPFEAVLALLVVGYLLLLMRGYRQDARERE